MIIRPNGDVLVCCYGWTNGYTLGNVNRQGFEEIWNSSAAQAMRASIHDGTFRYCHLDKCGRYAKGELSSREMLEKNADLINSKQVVLDYGPEEMGLNYDPSCNLACPSCRTGLEFAPPEAVSSLIAFQNSVISSRYFKQARRIRATGTGDVFASKVYAHLFSRVNQEEFPNLTFQLRTNGILLTPRKWEEIKNVHYAITQIIISIDAATEETYEKVRGKGFKKLMANLDFLRSIKADYRFTSKLCFVMQQANYLEIPDFVRLGKRFEVDEVLFTRIRNWGTFSNFKEQDVFDVQHPEHRRYCEVMKDPVLEDPVVHVRHLPTREDLE